MAKAAVHEAEASTDSGEKAKAVARAKNALSSAFANSTDAERRQLHNLQEQLDQLS